MEDEVAELCEKLTRHAETTGSDVLEKNFVQNGHIIATVFVVLGSEAEAFQRAALRWLDTHGYKRD